MFAVLPRRGARGAGKIQRTVFPAHACCIQSTPVSCHSVTPGATRSRGTILADEVWVMVSGAIGRRKSETFPCPRCNGKGQRNITHEVWFRPGEEHEIIMECARCRGTGVGHKMWHPPLIRCIWCADDGFTGPKNDLRRPNPGRFTGRARMMRVRHTCRMCNGTGIPKWIGEE